MVNKLVKYKDYVYFLFISLKSQTIQRKIQQHCKVKFITYTEVKRIKKLHTKRGKKTELYYCKVLHCKLEPGSRASRVENETSTEM